MSDAAAKVALLFDDAELVGQLRAALQERNAQIVHEGSVAQFSPTVLGQCGAEVLVVNLEGDDVAALDRLHEMIDGDRPRLVFNDAHASRGLQGWDRARWARHLAVKVLAGGDLDPPRPLDAPVFDAAVAAPAEVEPASTMEAAHEPVVSPQDDARLKQAEAASASLAAELEAMLAADRFQVDGAEGFGAGLKLDAGAELPPLYDGDFAEVAASYAPSSPSSNEPDAPVHASFDLDHLGLSEDFGDDLKLDAGDELPPLYDGNFTEAAIPSLPPSPPSDKPAASAPATFNLDHLSLLPLDDALPVPPPVVSEIQLEATPANLTLGPSATWSLVDDDVPPPSAAAEILPVVDKLSAAEYLAPQVEEQGEPPLEPGLSLQLVSQEEAVAPQSYQAHEMQLDDLGNSALRQIAVLGAAVDSEEAVCSFLAALPARLRLPVLLVQHLRGEPVDDLILRLALHSPWPVKLAAPGARARIGEVLVVPPGTPLRLLRDGQLERQGSALGEQADTRPTPEVSIDATLSAIALVFGRDARAIVFAGRTNDALGGAQAIHARGGQVWVEQSARGHYANMVDAILAERLVSFSGTPPELAARLGEETSMDRYSTENGR